MTDAILNGFGVGILPKYLVKKHLSSGKIDLLPLKIKLDQDTFRLVYRNDRDLTSALQILSQELKRVGLQ
jgi:DNA-binding transcriptional LysR family regulator